MPRDHARFETERDEAERHRSVQTLLAVGGSLILASLIGAAWLREDPGWRQGGTLHWASVEEWLAASHQNKLATTADFIAQYESQNRGPSTSLAREAMVKSLQLNPPVPPDIQQEVTERYGKREVADFVKGIDIFAKDSQSDVAECAVKFLDLLEEMRAEVLGHVVRKRFQQNLQEFEAEHNRRSN